MLLRSYLSPVARRVAQLESVRATTGRCPLSLEEQAWVCRNFLVACACGHVERTPEGYRAITDDSTYGQPFEIEPGRWERRCKIVPEIAELNITIAKFLTEFFKRTGKYFPVGEEMGRLSNPEFVAAVYRHYGARILDE